MLVHEIIEYNAAKLPGAVALVSENGQQTWREVDDLADCVANFLASAGVCRGDRVSVLSRNCIELIAILAAASKLGAVYAPLNYRLSPTELGRILDDCKPVILFVHVEFAGDPDIATLVGAGTATVVEFDHSAGHRQLSGICGDAPARPKAERGHDEDPLWICYTGGSTGRPKGVVLSHRNMTTSAQNFTLVNRIASDDAYLLAGPMYHVVLAVPIGYWLAGARTVIMNFDAARALDLMQRQGVTRMVATGTIFKMLVDEMSAHPREGLRLRNIDFGGAPIPVEMALRASDIFGCTVGQIYGQSEASVLSTYLPPEDYLSAQARPWDESAAARLRSVGKAAPCVLVGVMDARGELLPPGDRVGEIVVKGDTVMLGYWNQDDLTASTITNGWLRTGDLGRMDADGYVYLFDRIKDVIISGGENVYSSEVELALSAHPEVDEAVVIGKPDPHWGETVHAIVVPAKGCRPTPEELTEFCRDRIARYKVPRSFDFRYELPRLPTGKIAKHELRSPAPVETAYKTNVLVR
jgi:long-chain acyl-CoA synthetase